MSQDGTGQHEQSQTDRYNIERVQICLGGPVTLL